MGGIWLKKLISNNQILIHKKINICYDEKIWKSVVLN